MAVTPAGAEVSSAVATSWKKIWKKNLKPLADKRYYTKKQSDAAYQPKGSYELHWADLSDRELRRNVTSRTRTVIDCARAYDYDVALSVADSALREGIVDRDDLLLAAARSPRTRSGRGWRSSATESMRRPTTARRISPSCRVRSWVMRRSSRTSAPEAQAGRSGRRAATMSLCTRTSCRPRQPLTRRRP